ncbi:MAG: penicillin-binding protein 2 [Planctomycetota bacterium]
MAIDQRKREKITRIVALLLFSGHALIVSKLVNVQITKADSHAREQAVRTARPAYKRGSGQFERGRRGTIVDARGTPLALGFDTYRLVVDPGLELGPEEPDLRARLDICADALENVGVQFRRDLFLERGLDRFFESSIPGAEPRKRRRRVLIDGLEPAERDYLASVLWPSVESDARPIRGFTFEAESAREYPSSGLVSEIVGFVGQSATDPETGDRGRAGIEYALDRLLAGTRGAFFCQRDGRGREYDLNGFWLEEPRDGVDIGLTIDVQIQDIVDRAIRKVHAEVPCAAVSGIVLETATGRILAMKSTPSATIEDLREGRAKFEDLQCRAATHLYPPGSTFKPFVVARALEAGVVDWGDRFDTNNGRKRLEYGRGGRIVNDSKPHQILSLSEVISLSSNIGMAEIGLYRLKPEGLHDAITSFGFGKRTGILIPGEPRGDFTSKEKMNPLFFGTSASYGQEISLTPLQLAARFSIFGTGGVYAEPTVVAWVKDGERRVENRRRRVRMVREDVANAIRAALVETVETGTAKFLNELDWSVAAKTGTAQILPPRDGVPHFNSSVVALAPAETPRITVYVAVHEVSGRTFYGGSTAGPAVGEIIDQTLRLLGEPPNKQETR